MKFYLTFLLICISSLGQAIVVIWPDSTAPCNGTLQACINASSEGDTVEIHTNVPIDESPFVDVAISVVAGIGYKPVFSSGTFLQIYTATSGTAISISVKGLTFEQGAIYVGTVNRPIIVYIENNTILDNIADTPGINIISSNIASTESVLHINYNTIRIDSSSSIILPDPAIKIYKDSENTGSISGEIINNVIDLVGYGNLGIDISVKNDADLSLNIIGNEITGGSSSGINARRNFSSGTTSLNIVSNAFYQKHTMIESSGLRIANFEGTTHVNIINNTMIKGSFAVRLEETTGTLTANVHSNIVAFTNQGFDFGPNVTVINDYNLYYQNGSHNNYTPGANAINADPQIIGFKNVRLRANSPALEAGNPLGLLLVAGTPLIDADGLHRIKNSSATGSGVIDIGAYEAGDLSFNHTSTETSGHITTINNSTINGISNLDSLHVTSIWDPLGVNNGIYNNDNEGIFYSGGFWRIFNENYIGMENGASFNVSKYASTANTFEHLVTSSGSNSSAINHVGLDANPQKILQVSQHWKTIYNPNPPGVLYVAGNWQILNFNLFNIPINSNYNVYYQDKSKSAYEHIAKNANTLNNYTFLNNPLINGVACAQIQVTQSASQGIFNNAPIGVFHDKILNNWAIFNQDLSDMPENAAFHVLINPAQIAECSDLIFKNDFE